MGDRMMPNFIDETGKIYGRLVVLGLSHMTNQAYWFCKCKCGVETVVEGGSLRAGRSRSCGCVRGERHGHSRCNQKSPEYVAWISMLQRCQNPNSAAYHYYGGRGIRVCPEWMESFTQFYADMGKQPGPDYSVDRIDNSGDYGPNNCRWATKLEQMANMQNNILLTFASRTQHVAAWCREFGVKRSTYDARRKRGWTPERSLGQVSR